MSRLRYDFITGLCSLAGTTLTLASGIPVTVNSGNYLPVAINPSPFTAVVTSINTEIIWVTAYTAGSTTATVLRGQEGTSALTATVWPTGTPYAHGSTAQDFGLVNEISNGDFPAPTASGQILISTSSGAVSPVWASPSAIAISGYYPSLTVSGNQIFGNLNNATISGNNVYGYLGNATISGSQVIGAITSISGFYPNLIVSGNEVYGDLSANATISGGKVYGALVNATIPSGNVTGASFVPTNGVTNQYLIYSGSGPVWQNQSSFFIPNNTAVTGLIENGVFTATSASGSINLNIQQSTVWYYTSVATGNFTINLTGSGGGTVGALLTTGQSITTVFLTTNGAIPYTIISGTGFTIDGVIYPVLWQGGTAPASGIAINGVDAYSFVVLKTSNSPNYTVLASLTGF